MARIMIWSLVIVGILLTGCSSGSSSSTDTPPVSTGSYTVGGTIRYEDLEYASSGQTSKSYYKPVRNASVDLISSSGATLATSTTDLLGTFHFSTVTTQPAKIRVVAHTTMSSGTEIFIKSTGKAIWTTTMSLSGLDLTLPVAVDINRDSTAIAGVFNMLDSYANGLEYVASQFTPASPLPTLNIYWPNSNGTYTCDSFDSLSGNCPAGMGVYVLGEFNSVGDFAGYDQDHYDDDVLWHELAHYVEYALAISESPGGIHSFYDNTMDLRLAWSEGHADYFQSAVKRWLANTYPERLSLPQNFPPTYYVDTALDGTLLFPAIDLANPGGYPYVYATNEVAVAKVVWEVSDKLSEYSVWSAWTGSWWSPNTRYRDHSLELFWDGLLFAGGLTTSQLYPLFNERSINYASDSFELQNDGTLSGRKVVDCTSAATTCLDEYHTHYLPNLVKDLDIVPISVTAGVSYTIKTRQLTNGADTKLRLLDGNGQLLIDGGGLPLENDDIPSVDCDPDPFVVNYCNNGTNFSSQMLYTPSANSIVYVEASNADFAIYNAGAYGGYTLTVTAN